MNKKRIKILSKAILTYFVFFGLFIHAQEQHDVITKQELIEQLFDIGSIQFGDFVLKVSDGYIHTPIYIDMRRIMSHPPLMKKVINLITQKAQNIHYDVVCGVPYAALVYAAGISLENNKPMIMSRQVLKHYGTRRTIEGIYKEANTVLLIEDVIVSGASVLAATELLRQEGLKVHDVIVLCDRQQGALSKMIEHGLKPHVLFTMSDILMVLKQLGKIEPHMVQTLWQYIQNNQCT